MEVGASSGGSTSPRGRLGGSRSGRPGSGSAREGLSPPLLRSLIPVAVFGLQFPGGNDNYLTITGPSHPFLSGAEVSRGWRRWGAEGPGQRLGRTATEASRASETTVGDGGNEREAAVIRKPGCRRDCLFKEGFRSECEERMELSALFRVK